MPDINAGQEALNNGQGTDPLAELEAKDPDVRTAKRHGSRTESTDTPAEGSQNPELPTAKDTGTVRGKDEPQAVRYAR